MDLTLQGFAIGNGILTVENEEQAIVRADPGRATRAAMPRGRRSRSSSFASNTRPNGIRRREPFRLISAKGAALQHGCR